MSEVEEEDEYTGGLGDLALVGEVGDTLSDDGAPFT